MSLRTILNLGIQAAGALTIGLVLSHVYITKLLDWREDVKNLRPINAQVFWAHTLFICWGLFLLGLCYLGAPQALTERSLLGLLASACFALCWFARLIFQFFFFGAELHQNKKLNQILRVSSTLLWLYFTTIFAILFFYQCGVIN